MRSFAVAGTAALFASGFWSSHRDCLLARSSSKSQRYAFKGQFSSNLHAFMKSCLRTVRKRTWMSFKTVYSFICVLIEFSDVTVVSHISSKIAPILSFLKAECITQKIVSSLAQLLSNVATFGVTRND